MQITGGFIVITMHCHLKRAKSIKLIIINSNINFNIAVFTHELLSVNNGARLDAQSSHMKYM